MQLLLRSCCANYLKNGSRDNAFPQSVTSSCCRLRPLASSSLGNVNVCYLLYLFGCRCSVPKLWLRQEPRDSPFLQSVMAEQILL